MLLRAQVDEQLAHPGHRRAAHLRAATERAAEVLLGAAGTSRARGARRRRRRGPGRRPRGARSRSPALGLERALGLARAPRGRARRAAPVATATRRAAAAPRRARGGGRGASAGTCARCGGCAASIWPAGWSGLDQDEAARRGAAAEVDLDQPAVAALEPVLRARQVADVGAHRVVGERGAQVLRQPEPRPMRACASE